MTLKDALIEVKYLTLRAESLWDIFKKYNSVLAGQSRPYDMRLIYGEIQSLSSKRTALKSRISNVYGPVRNMLIRKKELQLMLRHLKKVNGIDGTHKSLFDRNIYEREADFKEQELGSMRAELENELRSCELEIARLLYTTEL